MDQRDQAQLSNANFEAYYKAQPFFANEDPSVWATCYDSFKIPLPMASRVNRNHPDRSKVSEMIVSELNHNGFASTVAEAKAAVAVAAAAPSSIGAADEDGSAPSAPDANIAVLPVIRTLPFIAEGLATQVPLSRSDIKRGADHKRLKRVLAAFNDGGLLTRQETVSMVPPLMLDVRPGMSVLDMCAAPGSKTSQLLEALVSGGYDKNNNTNTNNNLGLDSYDTSKSRGVVVANDVNIARIDILTHQTGRAPHSHPHLIITNNDATNYPLITNPEDKFDRVLCDVMCSGDGTLRKSLDLWARWNPLQGADLHPSQLRTLLRGMSMVKAGGIVVYSTCSLNPIEDEAVIAEALLQAKGAFELVDPTALDHSEGEGEVEEGLDDASMPAPANSGSYKVCRRLAPGLRFSPGVTSWKLATKEGDRFFSSYAEAAEYRREVMKDKGMLWRASMFPPTPLANEEQKASLAAIAESLGEPTDDAALASLAPLHLERSMRILPHLQDTGGFFVAALRCKKDFSAQETSNSRRYKQMQQEEREGGLSAASAEPLMPYVPVAGSPIEAALSSLLGLDPATFPFDRLFIRRQGFAQLTGAPYAANGITAEDDDAGNDSDGSPVTAGRPPRVAKLFLATAEAAAMMRKLPPSANIKQIGIKVFETYAKYSNDKFRMFADSLDTMAPYLAKQQLAAFIENNKNKSDSDNTSSSSPSSSSRTFFVRAPDAATVEWLLTQNERSQGRLSLAEASERLEVCTISGVSSSDKDDTATTVEWSTKKVASAAEWKQMVARKSFIVLFPFYNKAEVLASPTCDAAQAKLQKLFTTFAPLSVSAELDDAQCYVQIKILPHQTVMLKLGLNGAAEAPNSGASNNSNPNNTRPPNPANKAPLPVAAVADTPANPKSRECDDENENEDEDAKDE